jgi:hypothetical protein
MLPVGGEEGLFGGATRCGFEDFVGPVRRIGRSLLFSQVVREHRAYKCIYRPWGPCASSAKTGVFVEKGRMQVIVGKERGECI